MTTATPTVTMIEPYTNRQRIFRLVLAYAALILTSFILVVVGVNIGQNGMFDITAIGDSFVVFGGVGPFFVLVAALVVLTGLYIGVYFLSNNGHSHWTAIGAVGFGIVAFIVGTLVHVDLAFFGGLWPVVIYMVFLAGVTVAVGAILGVFRRN